MLCVNIQEIMENGDVYGAPDMCSKEADAPHRYTAALFDRRGWLSYINLAFKIIAVASSYISSAFKYVNSQNISII